MFYELSRKRYDEKTVGYAESHDQAMVGDKTIIFRLMDSEMYFNMNKSSQSLIIDRGIALHKMIRLITLATSGNAYLNFMANEFGHPEWIDFPREGNNWSYHYARRQWSLVENKDLRYHFLGDFDKDLINMSIKYNSLGNPSPQIRHVNTNDQVLAFERGNLFFIFNFNPTRSFPDYGLTSPAGRFKMILETDNPAFGGQGRIEENIKYTAVPERSFSSGYMLKIYLPARTAVVLERTPPKSVHG
jgi:1,4-alpha-glucan branching enzyme